MELQRKFEPVLHHIAVLLTELAALASSSLAALASRRRDRI